MKITGTKMTAIPKLAMKDMIASVGRRDAAFKKFVHGVACSALFHCIEFGNACLLIQLGERFSRPGDRKALIDWSLAHGPLIIDAAGKLQVRTGWKIEEYKLADMVDVTMWDFKPVRATKAITLDSLLAYVSTKGAKAVKGEHMTIEQYELLMDAFSAARDLEVAEVEVAEVEVAAAA